MVRLHFFKDQKSIYISFESEELCEEFSDEINELIDSRANWSVTKRR